MVNRRGLLGRVAAVCSAVVGFFIGVLPGPRCTCGDWAGIGAKILQHGSWCPLSPSYAPGLTEDVARAWARAAFKLHPSEVPDDRPKPPT